MEVVKLGVKCVIGILEGECYIKVDLIYFCLTLLTKLQKLKKMFFSLSNIEVVLFRIFSVLRD